MHGAIDDEKVIAIFVELVEVAAAFAHRGAWDRRHLFVEDAIAQTLRLFDFGVGFRKTHLKRTHDRKHRPLIEDSFE